ncbi:MAG: DUF305 domain-containing protein [Myxococcota bacterium]
MTTRHVTGLLVALWGVLLGGAAWAQDAEKEPASPYEAQFMADMIVHHNSAVEMARLCVSKAEHPELAALCDQMATDQVRDIDDMRTWLDTWGSESGGVAEEMLCPSAHEGMGGAMALLGDLEGKDFEEAFLTFMIQHHRAALETAGRCMTEADHAELVGLCNNIVVTQSAEIHVMRQWLARWFEVCA